MLNEPSKPNEELLLSVGAMVSSFVENALKSGEIYVKHANRNAITKTDLKVALMNETFHYLHDADTPENIERWRGIIQEFQEGGSESEDDEVCEYDGEPEAEEEREDEFKPSECDCLVCKKLNSVEEYWKQWEPNEGIETILKRTVDEKF